jgi:ribulose-5-phosphate 4-epimerase/fuculose-1-phosphate aldolase
VPVKNPERCQVLAEKGRLPLAGDSPCDTCTLPAVHAAPGMSAFQDQPSEGVIKFHLEHEHTPESSVRPAHAFEELRHWRQRLYQLRLIGQEPGRYDSMGYGNVSCRVPPFVETPNQKHFLITGTQTGTQGPLSAHGYALVREYHVRENRLVSAGPIKPSAESLTHGMIYDLFPRTRWVFHAHCPEIWEASARLGIPTTGAEVPYGTPEMANEVLRLRDEVGLDDRILAMAGHEDGVITFGEAAEDAGHVLVRYLSLAKSLPCLSGG